MKKLILLILLILFLCASPVLAAGPFYVSPAGTDGASIAGTSDATAFKTLTYALTRISAGEDIYLKCGGTWTSTSSSGYYTIPVSGASAGNPTVIGAYYMNNDVPPVETVGVPAGGQKPILDGALLAPSSTYCGLIYVYGKQYITIQDLDIYRSRSVGIYINNESGATRTGFTVQRCTVRSCYGSGIVLNSYSPSIITGFSIDNNDVTLCGYKNGSYGVPWSTGIGISNSGLNTGTVTNNTVHNMYGEGIDVIFNAHDVDVYQNIVYSTMSIGIYLGQGAYNLDVYKNLVYQTSNSSFWYSGNRGGGIHLVDEPLPTTAPAHAVTGCNIYNNAVVGTSVGIYYSAGAANSSFSGNYIYNNTVIDSLAASGLNNGNFRVGVSADSMYAATTYFRNNISWCLTTGCEHYTGMTSATNITWDHNLWGGGTAPTGEASGTGDVTTAPTLVKTSGFRDIADGGLTWADVKFSSASSAGVDAGADTTGVVAADAWGVTRPVNALGGAGGVDIGVHEWPVAAAGAACPDTVCDPATETCLNCEADCGACASGSFDCTDVSLIWDMEDKDVIQYTLGADTSFTLNSGAAVNTDANKAGTKGLDCPTPNDNAQLTLADGLVVSRLEGSVAFWMRLYAAPSNGATLWYAGASGSAIYITFIAGGNVMLNIYNGSYVSLQTTGAGMTATGNPWYFVIARWKHSTNDRWIGVYNASGVLLGTAGENLTTAWTAPPSEFTSLYLGNTNSASTFDVDFDYLLGVSKKYDTDWLSIDTEAKPDCSGEDPVSLALTEVAYPTVPLTGVATWSFNSTLAGTLAMSGPCYTETTTVSGGVNSITFRKLGKGIYSNCVAYVTDGDSNVVALSMSPFTVDGWNLERVGSGGFALSPASSGGFALTPVE